MEGWCTYFARSEHIYKISCRRLHLPNLYKSFSVAKLFPPPSRSALTHTKDYARKGDFNGKYYVEKDEGEYCMAMWFSISELMTSGSEVEAGSWVITDKLDMNAVYGCCSTLGAGPMPPSRPWGPPGGEARWIAQVVMSADSRVSSIPDPPRAVIPAKQAKVPMPPMAPSARRAASRTEAPQPPTGPPPPGHRSRLLTAKAEREDPDVGGRCDRSRSPVAQPITKKEVNRGGWFNRCQTLARAVLTEDIEEAESLAHGSGWFTKTNRLAAAILEGDWEHATALAEENWEGKAL